MKRCPVCNVIYADDTLTYCLTDGSPLSVPHNAKATQHLAAFHTSPIKLSAKRIRTLIVINWLLSFFTVLLHFATQPLLPRELQEYLETEYNAPIIGTDIFTLAVAVPFFLFSLIVWIGLFFFKRWARKLLLFSIAGGVLIIAIIGPTVELGLVTSLNYLSMIIEGIILTLVFFSPLSEKFKT